MEEPANISLSLTPTPRSASQPRLPRRLLGFSTKAFFDLPRTVNYLQSFLSALKSATLDDQGNKVNDDDLAIFILPSFPFIPITAALIASHAPPALSTSTSKDQSADKRGLKIWHGAQNTHAHPTGACTGEVPPHLLRQLGCTIICLGHAERRAAPFHEYDDVVSAKAVEVVKEGMIPLVCIGEGDAPTHANRPDEEAVIFCANQVYGTLTALRLFIPEKKSVSVVFAYEPVWAIGASGAAGSDYVCAMIRGLKSAVKDIEWEGEVKWLYGGSAGPGVWQGLRNECDGLFLGRFAHEPARFLDVIKEVRAT